MKARLAVGFAIAATVLTGGAQAPELSLRIVSPGPDTYLSGPVLLKAVIDPAPRARDIERVMFYADGRLVCTVGDAARAECPWDAGAEVKEHLVRVVADVKGGTRVVATTRTKGLEFVEKVSVDVVQVTAVVNDGNRFVKGLPKTAFRITEDGVPQTISHFSNEGSPLELVVAVDVSQSMAPNMPQLKNAVRKFLGALGPKDQVTLAAFNDNLFTLAKRETVAAQRLRAVDRLAPWGGTALYDVIVRGVQLLSKQPGRRVLVVFSDGDDRSSHATIANVEASMRSTDTTLFMVALGRGAREAQLRSGVQRLITLSGGRGLFVEKSENLESRLRRDRRGALEPVSDRLPVHQREARRHVARDCHRHARRRAHGAGAARLSRTGGPVVVRVVTVACAVAAVVTALAQGPVRAQSAPAQSAPARGAHTSTASQAPAPTLATDAPQAPVPSKAQFGVKTELVLVDASITDGESRPVTDLSVADFDLQVNGQSRPIASAQFISTLPPTPTAPAAAGEPTSNDAPTSGRLMLFVVDDGHIRVGGSQAIVRTSEMLLAQLAPGDMVGVARLPTGVGSVEFTVDRRRVIEALRRPAGTSSGPFSTAQVQISEAFGLETGDVDAWQRAIERECIGMTEMARESCADALEVEARNALIEATARASQTLRFLDVLFQRLARLGTPVNVVMISEGLFLGRTPAAMAEVSRKAAEARVTLHIIRPAGSMMGDASRASAPGLTFTMDDYLMRDGLEQLAAQTRGRMLQVAAGTGAGIFERLNRELSGYYLIGFEPTEADRTGRQRRIRLQVRRKGLTVRARPTFALPREAAATAAAGIGSTSDGNGGMRAPEEVVKELLASPLPDRGLPLRVATYNTADSKDSRVRVIITAEVGEPATAPVEWQTGILVLDRDDKPAAGNVVRINLSPLTLACRVARPASDHGAAGARRVHPEARRGKRRGPHRQRAPHHPSGIDADGRAAGSFGPADHARADRARSPAVDAVAERGHRERIVPALRGRSEQRAAREHLGERGSGGKRDGAADLDHRAAAGGA